MNFQRPEIKSRLLSPRIFIYVAILLIVAWWINRFGKLKEEQIPDSETLNRIAEAERAGKEPQ